MTGRLAFFLAGLSCGFLGLSAWIARELLSDQPYKFGGDA